jgi:hypothetical protein
MTYYVYSKLACHQKYVTYFEGKPTDAINRVEKSVTVRGQAGMCKSTDPDVITPAGVRTQITDEEYGLLKNNWLFNLHRTNGHVTVEEVKVNPNKVAKDLAPDEGSRPRVESDLKDKGPKFLKKKDKDE